MPSPFPGMDPYIETAEFWPDFHSNLASEIQSQLNRRIQPRYFARLTPYVTYEVVEVGQARGVRPDIGVWHLESRPPQTPGSTATVIRAPVESLVALETPLRLHSVEVRTTAEQLLVTLIEILSPVNKRPGHEAHVAYQRKRRDLLRSTVHLMEIDLLRGGARPPLERPVPPAPYYVVLSREQRRPTVEVWPLRLSERLPLLPVPLLEPDPDASLDLSAAVASVYERGAYGLQIDYRQPPPSPHLSEEESRWVEDILQGVRSRVS